MTPEQIELATKLVSSKNWKWPTHIAVKSVKWNGNYIAINSADGPWTDGIERTELYVYELAGDGESGWRNAKDFLPDLSEDDPSTGGILLTMLSGFCSAETKLYTRSVGKEEWECATVMGRNTGSTLAEACAKSIIQIWEKYYGS